MSGTDSGTFDYTYDAEGNRTCKTHIATGRLTSYAYDHRNRLTSATDWLVGPYPEDDGEGWSWGNYDTSGSTASPGDPDAGRYVDWDWGPSYASSSTAGGAITFEAAVASATEGGNVVLTLSASSTVQLEFWAEDRSASFMGGDYYWEDFWNGTGTRTVSGATPVTFEALQNNRYSPTKSFAIHVRAVGDPASEVVLEADIFNDDAINLSANVAPVLEGSTLWLYLSTGVSPNGAANVPIEWWIADASATFSPWYDEAHDYTHESGATGGELTLSATGHGQILFPTFPGQHQFELTQSFKIHLRVKNDPNASNVLIVEGRILSLGREWSAACVIGNGSVERPSDVGHNACRPCTARCERVRANDWGKPRTGTEPN